MSPYLRLFILTMTSTFLWRALPLAAQEVASLYSKQGQVQGRFGEQVEWADIDVKASFSARDSLRVSKHGRAGVLFVSGYFMRLSNKATIHFNKFDTGSSKSSLEIESGKAHLYSRSAGKAPAIKTPVVSAAIRGTEFVIDVAKDGTRATISVLEGQVRAYNEHGEVLLSKGEEAVTLKGQGPVKRILLNPVDAVQWTLYYPSLFSKADLIERLQQEGVDNVALQTLREKNWKRATELLRGDQWQFVLARAFIAASTEKPGLALSLLEKHGARHPELQLYRAEILLGQGMAKEAQAIVRSLERGGGGARVRANAFALGSSIALTQNRKEESQELCEKALQAERNSRALLACAYNAQARFDLVEAVQLLDEASRSAPENDLVLTRRAELALAASEIEESEDLLEVALGLNPDSAYAHTLRGFVYLFKNERLRAEGSFQRGLALEPGFALARMGSGLAQVAQGNLEQGKRELQTAAHLESRAGIYRSYLGKALFEMGLEDESLAEYETAISLDSEDPTPYLYRGFTHLSQNKPVAALRDIATSIEKNDNRAVYRSRMLLDQDLGVRGASIARTFSDLGFTRLARLEAIKSLQRDYSNFSAHRLLSEATQQVLEAQTSFAERRIADLLAPLSFNLFNSVGGAPSINDYNAVFDKDEERSTLSYRFEEENSLNVFTASQAGKSDMLGYYVNGRAISGDGSKKNDFTRSYEGEAKVQYQPTYTSRLIGELLYRYDDEEAPRALVQRSGRYRVEGSIGGAHSFSAHSTLIGQVFASRIRARLSEFVPAQPRPLEMEILVAGETITPGNSVITRENLFFEQEAIRPELQFIHKASWGSLVSGATASFVDDVQFESSPLVNDSFAVLAGTGQVFSTRSEDSLELYNGYSYLTTPLLSDLDFQVGGSLIKMRYQGRSVVPFLDGTLAQERFNPKLGLVYTPVPSLTLRAAWFEGIGKRLVPEGLPDIEPTTVAGFTQSFNEFPGTKVRNRAGGFDWRWNSDLFIGSEWLEREGVIREFDTLDVLELDFDALESSSRTDLRGVLPERRKEDYMRSYVYYVLSDSMVASTDHTFADVEFLAGGGSDSFTTHVSSSTLRYFHPSGFFASLNGTWRQQRLRLGSSTDTFEDFWTCDAGLGFRLPRRHGTMTLNFRNIFDEDFFYVASRAIERPLIPGFNISLVAAVNF